MLWELAGLGLLPFIFYYLRVESTSSFPPPLKKEEEEMLFRAMKAGSDEARSRLIEHNLRLVAHIVKKYDAEKSEQEDLISVGVIGLIKAIDSFNTAQGTRFATYAGKCVQNEILMYFRSQKKFASESSLNDALEVDKDGNPLTILDVMRVEDDVVDQIEKKSRTELALQAIRTRLNERERAIICLRFGLGGAPPVTQREVAKKLGISRSYVSRIEKCALEKIRSFLKNTRSYL